MPDSQAKGSCLCGEITFALRFPSKWIVHCHCSRCRRAHGSAFVTWVGADTEQVDILDPRHVLSWYQEPGEVAEAFVGSVAVPCFFGRCRNPAKRMWPWPCLRKRLTVCPSRMYTM